MVAVRAVSWRWWRREPGFKPDPGDGSLVALAALSLLAGAGSGLIVAIFRLALARVDDWRGALIARAHQQPLIGPVAVLLGCAASVALAAWLVRRFSPFASGSGIPQVEGALTGDLPPAPPRLIPVKFFGGLLAIGAGMALGREGPSVQMAAVVADLVGKAGGRAWPDLRTLVAAGAGAGLAVSFNAPIAGTVFVLEELVRRLEKRVAISALGASATAILISRLFLGDMPDFQVTITSQAASATGPLPFAVAATWPLYLVFGSVCGLAAGLYNRTILGAVALAAWLDQRSPVELQAAAIGALVGAIGWFAPGLIGGGDAITQRLLAGGAAIGAVPLALVVRFGLGAASYAARTPGGLFAPLLVLGAQLGFVSGALARAAFPDLGIEPEAFAVVGMAAFFTGVVQAPITGIVLVIEMTAAFTTLLPMLVACFAAIVAVNFLRTAPIYDSLRERVVDPNRLSS
jgi:chloride channel protein, CIC family